MRHLDQHQGAVDCFADNAIMEASPKERAISNPAAAGPLPPLHQTPAVKAPGRKWIRISPTVSWYGKILIIGALLVTFGWELFHLIITLMTLD